MSVRVKLVNLSLSDRAASDARPNVTTDSRDGLSDEGTIAAGDRGAQRGPGGEEKGKEGNRSARARLALSLEIGSGLTKRLGGERCTHFVRAMGWAVVILRKRESDGNRAGMRWRQEVSSTLEIELTHGADVTARSEIRRDIAVGARPAC